MLFLCVLLFTPPLSPPPLSLYHPSPPQSTTPLQHPPQNVPSQQSQVLHHSPPTSMLQQRAVDTGTGRQVVTPQVNLSGGQQTLRHTPPEVLLEARQPRPTTCTTVVLPQALMDPQGVQLQQQPPPPSPLLDTQGQYQLRHLDPVHNQGGMRMQSVVQQVLDHGVSEHFRSPPPLNPVSATEGGVEFHHIPESESISRSISPITATLQHTPDVVSGYHHHHQGVTALSRETASSLASSLGLQSTDSLQDQLASIVSTDHGTSQTKAPLANSMPST